MDGLSELILMNDGSWQWEVMHPMRLAALAAALPMIYYGRRNLVQLPPWRRAVSLFVRILLLAALVAALCDIRVVGVCRQPYVVAAVDRSASISAAAHATADVFLNELARSAGGNRMSLLPFAARPGVVGKNVPPLDSMGSDLAAAVAAARAAIPARYVPRIVLLTDGNETEGALRAAAQAAGVPISVVPLPGSSDGEVYVVSVRAPRQVREGEPFTADVVVWSCARTNATSGCLEAPNLSPIGVFVLPRARTASVSACRLWADRPERSRPGSKPLVTPLPRTTRPPSQCL